MCLIFKTFHKNEKTLSAMLLQEHRPRSVDDRIGKRARTTTACRASCGWSRPVELHRQRKEKSTRISNRNTSQKKTCWAKSDSSQKYLPLQNADVSLCVHKCPTIPHMFRGISCKFSSQIQSMSKQSQELLNKKGAEQLVVFPLIMGLRPLPEVLSFWDALLASVPRRCLVSLLGAPTNGKLPCGFPFGLTRVVCLHICLVWACCLHMFFFVFLCVATVFAICLHSVVTP